MVINNALSIIKKLDIRRPQVLVEAVIAEVTEDNTRELGVNFLINGLDNGAPIGFSNLGGTTEQIANSIDSDQPSLPSIAGGVVIGSLARSKIDFGLLLQAIASDSDNNIISTPSIVTLNNEEAEIIVGSNVPFLTGQQLSANNDNPFQTIEREDVGLTLKVTPQINDGDTIKLELLQEVSNLNTTSALGTSDITTSKRSIQTTVLIDDGETMVLGGLIDDMISETTEKVPLLGDIPLVGGLFRHKSTTSTKRNLIIFLRPVILRNTGKTQKITNQRYTQIREKAMSAGIVQGVDEQLPPLTPSQQREWVELDDGSMLLQNVDVKP